jgi:hypothetical protein
MTTLQEAKKRIGQHIKSDHDWAYKSGQWATIVGVSELPDRLTYSLRWPDGNEDTWVVDDATASYQFRDPFEIAKTADAALLVIAQAAMAVMVDVRTPGVRSPRILHTRLTEIFESLTDAL